MTDRSSKPNAGQPDALRRKLAKAGVAAPIVLATLVSKPVLGAATHNCTISGQVSGNVSTHAQGDCKLLGTAATGWVDPATWPQCAYFFTACGTGHPVASDAKLFSASPDGGGLPQFVDAYNNSVSNAASVYEVLDGTGITPKGTFVASAELGREAVAALLSSLDTSNNPNYPVLPADVIYMFNSVAVGGGTYTPYPGATPWDAISVLNYFKMLHA